MYIVVYRVLWRCRVLRLGICGRVEIGIKPKFSYMQTLHCRCMRLYSVAPAWYIWKGWDWEAGRPPGDVGQPLITVTIFSSPVIYSSGSSFLIRAWDQRIHWKENLNYISDKDSVLNSQFWNSREVLLIHSSQKQTKCSTGQMMARTIGHVTSMYSIRAPTCYSSGSRAQWLWCKPVFCQRVAGINFSWSDVAYIEDTAHQYLTKYG